MSTALWFLIFAIKISFIHSQLCHYVRDLPVKHRDLENSEWQITRVTGCISDVSFKNKIVEEVNITCDAEIVPVLEKNFIANMKNLRTIFIDSCHIEIIEPGAFANLPELRTITIEGNPLKIISKGVFDVLPSVRKLYLHYNKISGIEDHAFANLPNLRQVSLEANKLEQLKKEWFINTTSLQQLLADKNLIRRIPSELFEGWKELTEVNLNQNAISLIEDGAFKHGGASTMKYVALHHNRLTSLSPNIFSSSVFIDNLFISGNLLNYLSKEFLETIRVQNLYIFGNPFTCSCLARVNKILLDRGITVDDSTDKDYVQACKDSVVPVCGYSSNSSHTCSDSVDKEVTSKMFSQMKNSGYASVHTEDGYKCAMLDSTE